MKGVILAAGKGTRMLPLTQRRPKPLVPVLDRPMIEHIVCGARDAGVDHQLLVVGYLGEQIRECLGDGSRLGVRLEYVWQEVAGGTGAAVLLAEEFIASEPFFLSWGDIMVGPQTYQNVTRAWHEEKPDAVLSLNYVEDPWEGAAVYVEEGYISRIVEKPPKGTSSTNYNNAGIFVFGPELLEILKDTPDSARGEKEVPDGVQTLLGRGRRIRGLEVEGYWSDVARPGTVLALNGQIMRYREPSGVLVSTEARLDRDAELIAPVFVGPGCEIGAATVGPDTTLIGGVQVGAGAKVAQTVALEGSSLGEGCVVTNAIVEEGVVLPDGLCVTGDEAVPAVLHRG